MADDSPETRVYVAEDDGFVAQGLEIYLRRRYVIQTFGSGSELLEAVESEAPDVYLLDYALPDMSGLDLLRDLRERAAPDIPAIMISAHHRRREESLAAGFCAFLGKPFPPAEVIWAVERALKRV